MVKAPFISKMGATMRVHGRITRCMAKALSTMPTASWPMKADGTWTVSTEGEKSTMMPWNN